VNQINATRKKGTLSEPKVQGKQNKESNKNGTLTI